MELVNIGFGNTVPTGRIIALVSPESALIKRLVQDARDGGMLVDSTFGRRTRAVLVMDSGHIVLSALSHETAAARIREGGFENSNKGANVHGLFQEDQR